MEVGEGAGGRNGMIEWWEIEDQGRGRRPFVVVGAYQERLTAEC